MSIIEHIISYIAPHRCLICEREGALLCETCMKNVSSTPPVCYRCLVPSPHGVTCCNCVRVSSLASVQAVTSYSGAPKALVAQLKFNRANQGANAIATMCDMHILLPQDVLITHVPTANNRIRERGYDQAALIARQLAAKRRMPYAPLLTRTSAVRQVGSSGKERRQQLAGAFRAQRRHLIANKCIILVDDVITTGSSLEACALALKQAGAAEVHAVVFARA